MLPYILNKILPDENHISILITAYIHFDFQRFALNTVNLGMDYTFQFNWIYGNDFRNKSISTSTN